MLCACSVEQFRFEEAEHPQSPQSLATRDFSAGGVSSRNWEANFVDDDRIEEVETTLRDALSLNYEEARALLGRLEYQKGNFDAAFQVLQGIDIHCLAPKMRKSIAQKARNHRVRSKGAKAENNGMSMHSVSLLLEAILLKARSMEQLGFARDASRECKILVDTVESALPNGMPIGVFEECKLEEMFHKSLELLPALWNKAGCFQEAVAAYRHALIKPWNLEPKRLARLQKDLASTLLFCGVETPLPPYMQTLGAIAPKNNIEEAILLLRILMKKMVLQEIVWDPDVANLLTYSLSISGRCDVLANHIEQLLPGIYHRAERWYLLALCYYSDGQDEAALNLLRNALGKSEKNYYLPSLLLSTKLCAQNSKGSNEAIDFACRAMDLVDICGDGHLMSVVNHLLGVAYGSRARISTSDKERLFLQDGSVKWLRHAVMLEKENPEVVFNLGVASALSRNLNTAFDAFKSYLVMTMGSSVKGWMLLALVVSAKHSPGAAEAIIDLALDETAEMEHLSMLRLKGMLQKAECQPANAVETYQTLLALIQAQKQSPTSNSLSEVTLSKKLECEAWQDLAEIYIKLQSWDDAKVCVDKAMSFGLYSAASWHATGSLFEAQMHFEDALMAFSVALSIESDHVPSMVSAASVLAQLGEKSMPIARSLLMNALRLAPTNYEAWLKLGYISKVEGSLSHAADCFQAAFDLKYSSSPVQDFI